MKASEYRDLSIEELIVKEKELAEALFTVLSLATKWTRPW
jgi:ribosomal protein L29